MASVKVKFRPSTIEGKEGTIYYQIIQNRVIRQLKTDYRIFTDEWNEAGSCIIVGSSERSNLLLSLQERMEWDLKRLDMIIRQLNNRKTGYTADDIIVAFQYRVDEQSFFNFMQGIIARLKQMGKIRTAENYSCTLKSFMQFRGDRDVLLSEIDSDLMQLYEAYLHGKGAVRNTSSFYMRILRAVYNRALEKELIEQRNPFKHVYTGIAKTVKRAIPITRVKYIANLNFDEMPGLHKATKKSLEYARDMFMFSFYTRGMSFVDMCYLKKSDLKNGYLVYCRRKTGQQLFIKWEDCMEDIRKRHSASEESPYLLDLLDTDADLRNCLKRKQFSINFALKKIGELAGVGNTLTMYVARHSWASACKNSNIPLSVISEGMGHDSEETTRIYLASLDTSIVDKANRKIIKQVVFPKTRN